MSSNIIHSFHIYVDRFSYANTDTHEYVVTFIHVKIWAWHCLVVK